MCLMEVDKRWLQKVLPVHDTRQEESAYFSHVPHKQFLIEGPAPSWKRNEGGGKEEPRDPTVGVPWLRALARVVCSRLSQETPTSWRR